MARPLFRAPTGTRDILAPESQRRRQLVDAFADLSSRAGFGLLESPIFENVGVFKRLGEASDVVTKELFEFTDKSKKARRFALRPELTASVCRAFVEHRPPVPFKIWYCGPQFRYERPQAGRYRQFEQVGVETLGTDDPHADIEVIALAARYFKALGLRQVELLINSLGDAQSRPPYIEALSAFLQRRSAELSQLSRHTLQRNPLRVLDSKRPQDQPVIAEAPLMADFLSGESADHYRRVLAGLESLGIDYRVSPRLVRGLDYYTRTTFEFAAHSLDAAQNAVGGGGRYDRLVADLGGPPTPGIGLALGIDRIALACDAEGVLGLTPAGVDVFVVDVTGGQHATMLCDELRQAGLTAERAFDGRSMKAQMKRANRCGATAAAIVGPDEVAADQVTLRDLKPMQSANSTAAKPMARQWQVDRASVVSEVCDWLTARR